MRWIVRALEQEQIETVQSMRKFPDFRPGDILEVRMVVPENMKKEYVYKGVCVQKYLRGLRSAFKLYNVFPDVGGFVQHIPLYMPDLLEIKVIGRVPFRVRSNAMHLLRPENNDPPPTEHTYQHTVTPPAQ